MSTKIKRVKIDDRDATVTEMGDGLVKILFDDGEMRIACPVDEDEEEGEDE
jgi:hypothetical protein